MSFAIKQLSRKTARQAVADLISRGLTDLVATYDHEHADFGRRSPVAMVYSDGTAPMDPGRARVDQHSLLISLWWSRSDDDATEDYIDDLADELRRLIEANRQSKPDWTSLTIDDGFSEMDYPIVDGVMYRRETIRVIIW